MITYGEFVKGIRDILSSCINRRIDKEYCDSKLKAYAIMIKEKTGIDIVVKDCIMGTLFALPCVSLSEDAFHNKDILCISFQYKQHKRYYNRHTLIVKDIEISEYVNKEYYEYPLSALESLLDEEETHTRVNALDMAINKVEQKLAKLLEEKRNLLEEKELTILQLENKKKEISEYNYKGVVSC